MIERAGLAVERREKVDRIKNHGLFLQGARMRRDDLPLRDDHDAVDVALDRHHLEGVAPRHAVSRASIRPHRLPA